MSGIRGPGACLAFLSPMPNGDGTSDLRSLFSHSSCFGKVAVNECIINPVSPGVTVSL